MKSPMPAASSRHSSRHVSTCIKPPKPPSRRTISSVSVADPRLVNAPAALPRTAVVAAASAAGILASDNARGIATTGHAAESRLTSVDAGLRLKKCGPNAMPYTSVHPLRMAVEKFWAPVPWMLEAAIILELVLGKYVEAAIIAALLIFNAALGLFQESRAQATLAALKSRLALNASVRRDGAWKTIS